MPSSDSTVLHYKAANRQAGQMGDRGFDEAKTMNKNFYQNQMKNEMTFLHYS